MHSSFLDSNSITFSYFCAGGYPAFDYLEYPFLMGQNMVLLLLLAHYKGTDVLKSGLFPLAVYAAAVSILASNRAPESVLQLLNVRGIVVVKGCRYFTSSSYSRPW